MENSVCAIVVTYNRSQLLQKCVDAIKNQTADVSHIMVIDNNSTDDTQKVMQNLVSNQVIYQRLDKNYGGAGGFKRGIQKALANTHDKFFWIMDDDTIPTKGALAAFISATESLNDFGFLTADVHWKDGSPMNVPFIAQDWSVAAEKGLIKVQMATFVSLFVERKHIQKVGLPFEDFFIWHDDSEYTSRLSQSAPGYFVPNARVIHESGSNNAPSIYSDGEERIPRYFYLYRNEMYVCRHYRSKAKVWANFFRDLYTGVKVLFVAPDHKLKRSLTVLKGTFSGLRFRPRG